MISLVGNRPVLQVGRHQVANYDTGWLLDALRRAAAAAELEQFPFIDEIGEGVVHYLEHKCPLRMLPVDQLHERIRRMLEEVGCRSIARHFAPCAPPVTVSLVEAAHRAGPGFELAFFESIRGEAAELQRAGAAAVRFQDHEQAVRVLCGTDGWDAACERLLAELHGFLAALGADPPSRRPLASGAPTHS